MSEVTSRLHAEIDAELNRLRTSGDRVSDDEPELAPYETRLRSLRDAVVAVEAHSADI